MRRVVIIAAMAVAISLSVTACLTPLRSQQPAPSPPAPSRTAPSRHSPPARPLTPVPAPANPLVGVYEPNALVNWSQVAEFAGATGVKPRIVVYYSGWKNPFALSFAREAWRHDAYVLVQLQPNGVTLSSIAAGDSDSYLRSFADAVVAFGHPVILSFGHEMNGTWYSWGAGRTAPATFVAAWRHIVTVFRRQGADNVTWQWTINDVVPGIATPKPWWPGAKYVTWVGIDGYYYVSSDTFSSVFGITIQLVRKFTRKPIIISETATSPEAHPAKQISNLFTSVVSRHLLGVVWFDAPARRDWRLENDSIPLRGFRRSSARLFARHKQYRP